MKKVLFTSVFIASLVSANAFAIQPSSSKIISHKEWSDQSIKFQITDIQNSTNSSQLNNLLKQQLINKPYDKNEFIISEGQVYKTYGKVNESVKIKGETHLFISNDSTKKHLYTVTTSMCTTENNEFKCVNSEDNVLLGPNDTQYIDRCFSFYKIFLKNGAKTTYTVTSVDREDGTTLFTSVNYTDVIIK